MRRGCRSCRRRSACASTRNIAARCCRICMTGSMPSSRKSRSSRTRGWVRRFAYLLRHWEKLTLFLKEPGAPLDNNVVERALKKAIRHRKNSLFYKTRKGAAMGDLFMSLIHTCELNGANPFDYLTELQRHAHEVKRHPALWMPWNYRQNVTPSAVQTASG